MQHVGFFIYYAKDMRFLLKPKIRYLPEIANKALFACFNILYDEN